MKKFHAFSYRMAGLVLGCCLLGGAARADLVARPEPPQVPPAKQGGSDPNLYQLSGKNLQVTYSTSGIDGRPHFSYKDAHQTLSFSGNEIRVQDTEVGKLVSVSIRRTVDTGSTSFTLVLPRIGAASSGQSKLTVLGLTTIHRISLVHKFNQGQMDTYEPVTLTGTASNVAF